MVVPGDATPVPLHCISSSLRDQAPDTTTTMRLDRFDLNLLVTLDALLETRNVTRASERLHIGQSSCSSALARLREHFGDELLVPMGRQLVLTPLAEALGEQVREALRQAKTVISRRPDFDPATACESFDICASDSVVSVLLAPMAQRLALEAPGVSLQINSSPGDMFSAFERGQLELMIVPANLQLPGQHGRERLFGDTLVALVDSANTQLPDTCLTPLQLAQTGHVVVRLGGYSTLTLETLEFPQYQLQWPVARTVDRFSLAPLFLLDTPWLAVLPRLLATHFSHQYPLRLVELPQEMAVRFEMDLVWPRHVHDAPAHRWLRERLIKEARVLYGSHT